MQALYHPAVDLNDGLVFVLWQIEGGDDLARRFDLFGGRRQGLIARLDLTRMNEGLAVKAEIARLPAPTGSTMLTFSQNGRVLLAAAGGSTVRLWEVGSGKLRRQIGPVTAAKTGLAALAVAPDQRRFVAATADRKFHVFDLMTAATVGKFAGHTGYIRGLAFSPDGKVLAAFGGASDNANAVLETISLWELYFPRLSQ